MRLLLSSVLSALCVVIAVATEAHLPEEKLPDILYCGQEKPSQCPDTYLATLASHPFNRDRLAPHQADKHYLQLDDISDFQDLYLSLNLRAPEQCWLINRNDCSGQLRQVLSDHLNTSSLSKASQKTILLVTTVRPGSVENGEFYYLIQPGSAASPAEAPRFVKEMLVTLGGLALLFATRMDDYLGIWLICCAIMVFVNRLPDNKPARR